MNDRVFNFVLNEGGDSLDLFHQNQEIAKLEESSSLLGTGISGGVSPSKIETEPEIGVREALRRHTNLYENYIYDLIYGTRAAINLDYVPSEDIHGKSINYKTNIPLPSREDMLKRALDNLQFRGIPLNEKEDLLLDIYSGRRQGPPPMTYSTGESREYVFQQEMTDRIWEERDIIPPSDDIGIKISKYF